MKQTTMQELLEFCEYRLSKASNNNVAAWNMILSKIKDDGLVEMEKQQSFANVNRVEVIQHSEPYNGRAYTNYNAKDVEIQLQDDNKTLKIFLK